MGKAHRDVEHIETLGRQDSPHPPTIGWRTVANVHSYVIDLACQGHHQLALGLGMHLIVQPAQHPVGRVGTVVLDKGPGDAIVSELGLLVALQEETSVIHKVLGSDQDDVWDL